MITLLEENGKRIKPIIGEIYKTKRVFRMSRIIKT